jgi:hypothetical protein
MGGQTTASFVKHSISSISTDATLTGGTITDTGTIGINLSNPNTWAAAQSFPGATNIGSLSPRFVFKNNAVTDVYESFFGSNATSHLAAGAYTSIRWGEGSDQPAWAFDDGISFAAGGYDTYSILSVCFSLAKIAIAGGNAALPAWYRTYTLPQSGTLTVLDAEQTWTASQKFNAAPIFNSAQSNSYNNAEIMLNNQGEKYCGIGCVNGVYGLYFSPCNADGTWYSDSTYIWNFLGNLKQNGISVATADTANMTGSLSGTTLTLTIH